MFADTLPSVGSRLQSLKRLEVCAGEEEKESQREKDRLHVHDKERVTEWCSCKEWKW